MLMRAQAVGVGPRLRQWEPQEVNDYGEDGRWEEARPTRGAGEGQEASHRRDGQHEGHTKEGVMGRHGWRPIQHAIKSVQGPKS